MIKFFRRAILLIPGILLVVGSAVFVFAATDPYDLFSPPPPRTGYDPLSADEQANAYKLLQGEGEMARSIANANTELLLVERHQEEKSVYAAGEWDRRSDVYVYNYDTDETLYSLINIDQNRIDHTEVLTKVQLPLTANETASALQIALDHEEIGPAIVASYQQWHPDGAFDPQDIQVSPFMFKGEQYGIETGKSAECGLNRCAHLMLALSDGQLLIVQPVVNLSTGDAFIPELGE